MIPPLSILGKEIGIYAITSLIGALLCGVLIYRGAVRKHLDELEAISTLLFAAIGVFVGMHLLYGLTMIPYLSSLWDYTGAAESIGGFFRFFLSIFGGSVFYGGLLGGLGAGYLYLKKKKLSIPDYADLIAVYIPFFHMFGRIGCFLGGCCYGVECSWGFTYTQSPVELANGVRRFPVQLLEALCLLVLFLILLFLYRKGRLAGRLLYLYLISYGILRFFLEFLRGDDYRGFLFGLSTSQIISLLILLVCIPAWLLRRRTHKA